MELLRKFLKIIFPESRTLNSAYLGLTVKTVKIPHTRTTRENDNTVIIMLIKKHSYLKILVFVLWV